MATHSNVLAWRIPGAAEPGGLLSMGSHRVGHDWSDLAVAVFWVYFLFLGFPWPCQFMAICLKVWHSAFYRLGHLTWHTWSLGGKWVCDCEMAHVGAWMWLCPAGLACLDLIGLPLIHLRHLIGPETPVTGLLQGQCTPLPLGVGRWDCGDWWFVQKSWLIYFIFRAIQESR